MAGLETPRCSLVVVCGANSEHFWHSAFVVLPVAVLNVLRGQSLHVVSPLPSLYRPGSHSVQFPGTLPNFPTSHLRQVASPAFVVSLRLHMTHEGWS